MSPSISTPQRGAGRSKAIAGEINAKSRWRFCSLQKLNPAWQAAVRHLLATPPHPKKAVKKKPATAKK
jgi:hypothetical protein